MLGQISAALLSARFGGDIVSAVTRRTVDEALAPAVLPVMAAELRRFSDELIKPYDPTGAWWPAIQDVDRKLRARADQLDGGVA
jgi:hypothetical protein